MYEEATGLKPPQTSVGGLSATMGSIAATHEPKRSANRGRLCGLPESAPRGSCPEADAGAGLLPDATHFHLALWLQANSDLGRFVHWLLTAPVRRYHLHYPSSDHGCQGRFTAFPFQEDKHLLTVRRGVERNSLRLGAGRPSRAWAVVKFAGAGHHHSVAPPRPVARPSNWAEWVNAPMTDAEVEAARHSVTQRTPFGTELWVEQTTHQLGLESSLRPRGRPPKPCRTVGMSPVYF